MPVGAGHRARARRAPAAMRGGGRQGALARHHPQQRGAIGALAALARSQRHLRPTEPATSISGTSSRRSEQGGDPGHAMRRSDAELYDRDSSGVTLDRFCWSGITTVNFATGAGHRREAGIGGHRGRAPR